MTDIECVSAIQCVSAAGAMLGEGPLWDAARDIVWWVDIKGQALHRHRVADGTNEVQSLGYRLTALGHAADGGFIGCGDPGFVKLAIDPATLDVSITRACTLPHEPVGNRFNDGKVDPAGNFWAGTMDDAEEAARGILYRLSPAGGVIAVRRDVYVSNGPAFDGAETMYHTDSARQRITRMTLSPSGEVIDRALFAQFTPDQGYPDGMTLDAEGCLWIAFWDGWCVRRLSPDGEILREIRLPVQRPTCPTFGGAALDRLFVTSATIGLDAAALADQPMAGGLLALDPDTTGIAPAVFGGR